MTLLINPCHLINPIVGNRILPHHKTITLYAWGDADGNAPKFNIAANDDGASVRADVDYPDNIQAQFHTASVPTPDAQLTLGGQNIYLGYDTDTSRTNDAPYVFAEFAAIGGIGSLFLTTAANLQGSLTAAQKTALQADNFVLSATGTPTLFIDAPSVTDQARVTTTAAYSLITLTEPVDGVLPTGLTQSDISLCRTADLATETTLRDWYPASSLPAAPAADRKKFSIQATLQRNYEGGQSLGNGQDDGTFYYIGGGVIEEVVAETFYLLADNGNILTTEGGDRLVA